MQAGEKTYGVTKYRVRVQWRMCDFDIELNNWKIITSEGMYDSNQVDAFRYAQMQSSILNKTGSSRGSASGNKSNLISKFSSLEETLNEIDADLRQLCSDTQVKFWNICRIHSGLQNKSTTM